MLSQNLIAKKNIVGELPSARAYVEEGDGELSNIQIAEELKTGVERSTEI